MNNEENNSFAHIPMCQVGPVKIVGPEVGEIEVNIPLATFETPLWPSVNRGARLSQQCGGILACVQDERMTRSILLQAPSAQVAVTTVSAFQERLTEVAEVVASTSRFCRLRDMHAEVVADLIYLRLEMSTGDAAGHNMVTGAAEAVMNWMLHTFSELSYVSISGNYCTDKKVSAVNGILGRGKRVIAELTVPEKLCRKYLKTTPDAVVDLNIKKNLIGTMLAGGVRSANAHFANMLLAFYLATGQDAANIVEGSQGFVHAETRNNDLYFSTTLPNLIVGTVGNGKDLPFVEENLAALGCKEEREPGANARRLAVVAAAAVLCGELSLLAAQTNPGELMEAHRRLERKG